MREVARMVALDCAAITEYGKDQARRAFADTVAVSFPGLKEPVYEKMLAFCDGKGEGAVPVPGLHHRVDAAVAALAWGTLSHAIDFDDSCPALGGHPSVVLLPVVLALAYRQRAGGRDAMEAYICGYEATNRVAIGSSVAQYDRGWHTTTSIGIMGAAVAACRLLGLSVEEAEHALGIAASMAAGLQANFGTMTKPLHPGFAAANAITAAELAALSVDASAEAFDSKYSYFKVYGGEYQVYPLERHFIEEGIIVKPYPSCGSATRPNDLALQLRGQYGVTAEDIAAMECRISQVSHNCLRYVRPRNGTEARFSLEYCIAQSLIGGPLQLEHFEDAFVQAQVASEPMSSLIGRIRRVVPEDLKQGVPFAKEYFEMEVTLRDGRKVHLRAEQPKGFPANPLSEEELEHKFHGCTAGMLDRVESAQLYRKLRKIDDETDFASLLDRIVTDMSATMQKFKNK